MVANTTGSALGAARDTQRRHAGRPTRPAARSPAWCRRAAARTRSPRGRACLRQYGTLNLNGGLNTNANTTLVFNTETRPTARSGHYSTNIYGGDLINLNGSALNVSGGKSPSRPRPRRRAIIG